MNEPINAQIKILEITLYVLKFITAPSNNSSYIFFKASSNISLFSFGKAINKRYFYSHYVLDVDLAVTNFSLNARSYGSMMLAVECPFII